MNNYQYAFTVFTPVYNRTDTLHRAFNSLMAQTFKDFEWIIIDNGSKECFKSLVDKWIAEADFPIRFITLEKNIGWHGAFNYGVELAQGELFFDIDSDDSCKPNTLECLKTYWNRIPDDIRDQFSAVTCLCCDQHGNLVGDKFPKHVIDSNFQEIRYKYHVSGEKKGFQTTDALRQFPFPEFENSFEADLIWRKIGQKYKTRYINEILVTWYINEEGRTDQLSFHSQKKQSAPGLSLAHKEVLNDDIQWFKHSPKEFFRSSVHYTRFSLHTDISLLKQFNGLTNFVAKALWISMLPIGILVFIKDNHPCFNNTENNREKPDIAKKHHASRPSF